LCAIRSASTLPDPCSGRPQIQVGLRILLFILVGLLLVRPGSNEEVVVELGGDPRRIIAQADQARAFVRRSDDPPGPAELDLVAAVAGEAPVFALRPAGRSPLRVEPPAGAVAGRNAALDWQLTGRSGDTVVVAISDAAGPLDSARIALDAGGDASGAFRVTPASPGWLSWSVAAAGTRVTTGAWVMPADSFHVLVVAGPAPLEAREVARALERDGIAVTLAVEFSQGVGLARSPAGLPETSNELDDWDVIIVSSGVGLTRQDAERLEAHMRAGGGLLLTGELASSLPFVTAGEETTIDARSLTWNAPAEFEVLPDIESNPRVTPLDVLDSRGSVIARSGQRVLIAAGQYGRGRWVALGIEETWRWSLQAGRLEDLAGFWGSVAAWLAGGARSPFVLSIDPAASPPGLPVEVRITALEDGLGRPDSVVLVRPGDRTEMIPASWAGEHGMARFIADTTGAHRVMLTGPFATEAGHMADSLATPGRDAWARLAILADRSGGAFVTRDSLDSLMSGLGRSGARKLRTVLVVLITALAFAEWILRRLTGRA